MLCKPPSSASKQGTGVGRTAGTAMALLSAGGARTSLATRLPQVANPYRQFWRPSVVRGSRVRMMASSSTPAGVRSAVVDDVADLDYLMAKVLPMVQEYRLGNADTENKVVEFLKPWDLLKELEGLDQVPLLNRHIPAICR